MSSACFPPQTGALDGTYLFDTSYRSGGSLSLADRAAYGLSLPGSSFRRELAKSIGATRRLLPSMAAPHEMHTRAPRAPIDSFHSAATSRIFKAMAGSAFIAVDERTRSAREGVRRQASESRRARTDLCMPVRFTVRCGARVLSGVVSRGRVIATLRHVGKEYADGNRASDR